MRRGEPMRRTRMKPSARGTAHDRRQREFGRMMFLSTQDCGIAAWVLARSPLVLSLILVQEIPACGGAGIQVMHLSLGKTAGRRRAPDGQTCPGCVDHHQDIDGDMGGHGKWYLALGYDGQQELRRWLIEWADGLWFGLTQKQRDDWDARALAQREDE